MIFWITQIYVSRARKPQKQAHGFYLHKDRYLNVISFII